jgi:cellulose synthase (UDP-forming)
LNQNLQGSPRFCKAGPLKKRDIWTMRFLILCGAVCLILFLHWLLKPEHIGNAILFWLLLFALLFKMFKCVQEWYHYWSVSIPKKPIWKTKWTVDMLTTACPGEPKEMITQTLHAMKAVKYPHTNYLCDEGNDPELKKVCEELGIIHVTRTEKKDAKAGNINNALKQASGEICVILDPDHVPVPQFLHRVLPYFENPDTGYVQCVQGYSNQDESFIAKAAAEQSYHFYGPMMMCMNTYGTTQAIGANCTFRRKALDSIGGHAPGLAEDMHTAMQLQAKGWKPLYIPEVLTRGFVPSTLSAYYKQQLKWSRGCFELLFRVYPILFKQFNWRQKIHHFTMPLFFLFGLVNFIDLLVPLVALVLAEVPWVFDLKEFALYFFPFFGASIVIRLFAQRWLMEKKERGLHLAGGVLRIATWWIFLIGLIYSIFNIKVPYIPTPKENEKQNNFPLCIPNIVVIICCIPLVLYGLSIDWTPYSLAMAAYAFINVILLGILIIASQQKLIHSFYLRMRAVSKKYKLWILLPPKGLVVRLDYPRLVSRPIALVSGLAFLFLSYSNLGGNLPERTNVFKNNYGGFYLGATNEVNILPRPADIKVTNVNWNSITAFKKTLASNGGNTIPVINLVITKEKDFVYTSITENIYDSYLERCAKLLRAYGKPVFLNFSPNFDIQSDAGMPEHFIYAWQYLYGYFSKRGISNVTWLWNPGSPDCASYYPGELFVDWIGVSCLDKKTASLSFEDLYSEYNKKLKSLNKPVMVLEFGARKESNQLFWFTSAIRDIQSKFPEIKSMVFYFKNKYSLSDPSTYFFIKHKLITAPFSEAPVLCNKRTYLTSKNENYTSRFIKGKPGSFSMLIGDEPFYIQGVAYNTAHDWRDGNVPLTRKQLEKDFEKIKAMGANTIRRYDNGIYDNNILSIAEEYDLKVLYGFWFDPEVDYYKDSAKVNSYIEEVEKKVRNYKEFKSVLAWCIGNETWGLLKHSYSKPYLVMVREHYLRMIEQMAQKIHDIDPTRPVISCLEHASSELPGELTAYRDETPSLDVLGVNSYYKEQISELDKTFRQFDSLRPYFVSEFGPTGYCNQNYNHTENGFLREESDSEKASWYATQWKKYISANKKNNVGGIAYCWQDRMEGSFTWFGISDFEGRLKPSYYALRETWTNKYTPTLPVFKIITPPGFKPGAKQSFYAVTTEQIKEKISFKWLLMKDEYLKKIGAIKSTNKENTIQIEMPEDEGSYRLYLFVYDTMGNITTSSIPINIKSNEP